MGQIVFAGGNNITLSQSISGQSATMTISAPNTGTTVFSAGISSGGNTSGVSGLVSNQLVFVGGNNITLSQSILGGSATLTISGGGGADAILSVWKNLGQPVINVLGLENFFELCQLDPKNDIFPGNMTVNTMYMPISAPNTTAGNSETIKIGIYTRNASTLSLLNSVSTSWGFAASSNNSAFLAGLRWITFDASIWSASPTFSMTEYYLGYLVHSSGTNYSFSFPHVRYIGSDQMSGTLGVSITSGNTSMGWIPFCGQSISTLGSAAALPVSIMLGELNKAGGIVGEAPLLVFNNINSNF